jgi:hypothetical protein
MSSSGPRAGSERHWLRSGFSWGEDVSFGSGMGERLLPSHFQPLYLKSSTQKDASEPHGPQKPLIHTARQARASHWPQARSIGSAHS